MPRVTRRGHPQIFCLSGEGEGVHRGRADPDSDNRWPGPAGDLLVQIAAAMLRQIWRDIAV